MMAAIRTTSGPNKAWRAAWMTQSGNAAPRERAPRTMPSPVASASRHPFAEPGIAADLDLREAEIETAFARLAETLEALARQQFEAGFADRAVSALAALDIAADPAWFAADWRHPVDMAAIEARCVMRLFAGLVETGSERRRYACEDGEPVDTLIRRWGFHAVDITPCADGRLAACMRAEASAMRAHACTSSGAMYARNVEATRRSIRSRSTLCSSFLSSAPPLALSTSR